MVPQITIRPRKIKKLLNKHFSKIEGKKVRVYLSTTHSASDTSYYENDLFYEATYYKDIIVNGEKRRKTIRIYEGEIIEIIKEEMSHLTLYGIMTRVDGWGDLRGFTACVYLEDRNNEMKLKR